MTDADLDAIARTWDVPRLNTASGLDARWIQAFVSLRVADALAQLVLGDRLRHLPALDRAWFKARADLLVSEAVTKYTPILDEGERHADR